AGLRLGYAAFPLSLAKLIEDHKEPWTINTLAQRAGIVAVSDRSFRNETFRIIKKEKKFLEEGFEKLGIDYIPSAVNYYLIRTKKATDIIASLKNKGILVRDCSNFYGLDDSYIRVAVKSRRHNALLLKELKGII
ncbi:MAG: aminotransferase class I/II-fold pyridoxal phosphate-dependent enzyme, partial [Nitrospirota bacterium]